VLYLNIDWLDKKAEYLGHIYLLNGCMTGNPRISLEQWRSLLAVVDAGGYAQAGEALHKSQSAVTYAVQKMEALLGVKVFEVIGRKAHLTPTGEVLYRRAKALLEEAGGLEEAAGSLAAGWEPQLRLAVEIIFPTWQLLQCFARFAMERPQTRIELYESVLSGTEEALLQRKVDLAICSQLPPGFAGDPLMRMRFIAVAHPEHPLHRLGRELSLQDLRKHRHLVIRDTGSQRRSGSWVGAEQSWTVSQKATSIHAVCMGLGFAWFPEDTVRDELDRGELKPLPMREGGERWGELYLVFADRDYAGPGALRLAEIIREQVKEQCRRLDRAPRRRSAKQSKKRRGDAPADR
jgi:DNA-binding transcriptional LysR family regulator